MVFLRNHRVRRSVYDFRGKARVAKRDAFWGDADFDEFCRLNTAKFRVFLEVYVNDDERRRDESAELRECSSKLSAKRPVLESRRMDGLIKGGRRAILIDVRADEFVGARHPRESLVRARKESEASALLVDVLVDGCM